MSEALGEVVGEEAGVTIGDAVGEVAGVTIGEAGSCWIGGCGGGAGGKASGMVGAWDDADATGGKVGGEDGSG